MTNHMTGSREEWLAARLALLESEKEHTRRGDELARQRQELPWVRIDKEYRFETNEGPASLADMFQERSQLLVYHFMVGPEYAPGCPSCSAIAAGSYELTPLKRYFRRHCREGMHSGFQFGLSCVGSSIGPMLIFLALGVMSILWMDVIAIIVLAQKLLPPKATIDVSVGLAITGLGILIVIAPSLVPRLQPM